MGHNLRKWPSGILPLDANHYICTQNKKFIAPGVYQEIMPTKPLSNQTPPTLPATDSNPPDNHKKIKSSKPLSSKNKRLKIKDDFFGGGSGGQQLKPELVSVVQQAVSQAKEALRLKKKLKKSCKKYRTCKKKGMSISVKRKRRTKTIKKRRKNGCRGRRRGKTGYKPARFI